MTVAGAAGDYRHLFRRSLAAAPDRLHFAAHSHHLWPDASYVGHLAAWQDAARHADRKWDRVMGELWPAAQRHVAAELGLPDPSTIVFASNTHDLLIRLVSAIADRPVRILTTDGEFHSLRRQAARWVEAGVAIVETVAAGPALAAHMVDAAARFAPHLIVASHVAFATGAILDDIAALAALASPAGPWLLIDGYHGFMAIDTDLGPHADRIFYTSGGYKCAMAGEGAAFLHCPPGYAPRPVLTGWYAEFDDLAAPPGSIGYAPDARRFLGATFDPSGLYRFVAVRDMLTDEGLDTAAISAHCLALKQHVVERIAHTPLGAATILAPAAGPQQRQARFLALAHADAPRWQAALAARDVVTDVRGDVLRIGFGLYQTAADVDRLLEACARL